MNGQPLSACFPVRGSGQRKAEHTASPWSPAALHPDFSTQLFYNALDNGQSQPMTQATYRRDTRESAEKFFLLVPGDTVAIVFHPETNRTPIKAVSALFQARRPPAIFDCVA